VAVPIVSSAADEIVGRLVVKQPAGGLNPNDLGAIVQSLLPELFRAASRLNELKLASIDRDLGVA
jgi:hypothetical protein